MATPVIPVTYTMAQDQRRAISQAKATQDQANHGATVIETQDEGQAPGYVIYVYNILNREWLVEQPPLFPGVRIPACQPGQKFAYTVFPAFVKEPYNKPQTTEMYYKKVDGRKCVTSLLNPSAFPGTNWDSQLQFWDSGDQFGNNLNEFGVFWSLTTPDEEEQLDKEIALFRQRVQKTMNALVRRGEELAAAGDLRSISPLHHFAMDYLGKSAPWHMTAHHMITCPNCGDPVREGIAYHRNSFGEKCIVDEDRYAKMLAQQKRIEAAAAVKTEQEPPPPTAPAPAPEKPKPEETPKPKPKPAKAD
jgi:hypothetical protein